MSSVPCLFISTTQSSNRISLKLYQGKMRFFWTSRSFTFHARLGIAIIKHDTNGIKRVIEKDVSQSHIYYWKKKTKKKNGTQQQPYKLLNKNTHLVLLRIQCTFSTRLRTKGGYINGLSLWQCFNSQSNLIITEVSLLFQIPWQNISSFSTPPTMSSTCIDKIFR